MNTITLSDGRRIPLEMHRVSIIHQLSLLPAEQRLEAILAAGFNTFLLQNRDVFLDMLTDSGVNAMSDQQLAAMMAPDDSYAGSSSFTRLKDTVQELFDMPYFLPAHQGRACEHLLAQALVKPGSIIPMNYHFTTAKAHILRCGGETRDLLNEEGLQSNSEHSFKGNISLEKLQSLLESEEAARVPFIRLEAGTNLIGGQPLSLENIRQTAALARRFGVPLVLDASLLQDNLYFIKTREPNCREMSIREITRSIADSVDIIYFSARKLGSARGGGICLRDAALNKKLQELVTLYEGFLTYGGMSLREMEALTVGLQETMELDVISQGPLFIEYLCTGLQKRGVPVVTPPGGLGCHLNAADFLPQLEPCLYPAGALAAAVYIVGGIRSMERGTMSEQRAVDGSETYAPLELLRLAIPRRVFTLSQIEYVIDRIAWLHAHRDLIGGLRFSEEPSSLRFSEEPSSLRFFFGRLEPLGDWPQRLLQQFHGDFPDHF